MIEALRRGLVDAAYFGRLIGLPAGSRARGMLEPVRHHPARSPAAGRAQTSPNATLTGLRRQLRLGGRASCSHAGEPGVVLGEVLNIESPGEGQLAEAARKTQPLGRASRRPARS